MKNNIPASVYRVQINETFTLKQTLEILPYLDALGIEGLYCSPIFESASTNGYDIVNSNTINPVIGGSEAFEALCVALKQREMQLILDVVPNHMGIKGKNQWWLDVLERGPESSYAEFFDIDWNPLKPELKNKVLLPILGMPYGQALLNQEIQLLWEEGKYWIRYSDYLLPVAEKSYDFIHEQDSIEVFNGKKGEDRSFDLLHELLERQHYRLAYWLVAGQEINYRRFFNINELAAIHIEKERVLNTHHNLVFKLLKEGKVQGLRIDHPDGLYDPALYFERLQEHHPALVVIEKILDVNEPLPLHWKVSGTVGYEYLNCLNGVFIQKNNESLLDKIYSAFIGHETNFDLLLYNQKKWFILHNMGSESNILGWKLDRLSELDRYYRDFTRIELTLALREIIACFPVYRTYIQLNQEMDKRDKKYLINAIEEAKGKTPEISPSLYDYIRKICLFELEEGTDFIMRLQQHLAPVMAKGLEDSVFYIFNRFLSLNEVGGDPKAFGVTKVAFHQFNLEKQEKWPLGFLPASTQDTKRSEDVRMRLNVLSELPDKWEQCIKEWAAINQKYKQKLDLPDSNTEYYLYQMLLGIWPDDPEEATAPAFFERVWTCFLKSLREAGIHTSWRLQNKEYEEAAKQFLSTLLSADDFYSSFTSFQKEIGRYGRLNSLSALVLRMGGCGIVDLYQGTEVWNYSLMDPDNRRAVDYGYLQEALTDGEELKLEITSKALHFRRRFKELFLEGEYISLQVQNTYKDHIVAYLRQKGEECVLVAAGRFFTELPDPPLRNAWKDTSIVLPKELKIKEFRDVFTGKTSTINKTGVVEVAEIFEHHSFVLLELKK